ncbi:MAG: hypothetical protein DLM61_24710 [Pseudonocardiales bacterium]|nr:hypothetical protein [Pseudonocardiales bacterium]PZS23044.1 MAG: hypothetical protein DLM61_24710 [Pseudonocardiales bacterium]
MLRCWVGPELLDSYEAEHRPVAEHNTARSADPIGSFRKAEQELPVDLGGRLAHVWLPSAIGQVSALDVLGPGLTPAGGTNKESLGQARAGLRRHISPQSRYPQVRASPLFTSRSAAGLARHGPTSRQ